MNFLKKMDVRPIIEKEVKSTVGGYPDATNITIELKLHDVELDGATKFFVKYVVNKSIKMMDIWLDDETGQVVAVSRLL